MSELWPLKKLNEICDVSRGKTITRKETVEGDVPVVAGGINSSYSHNTANRPAKVITVSGSGANAGFVNFWTIPIFASDCSTILPLDPNMLNVRFVYYAMLNLQDYISKELRRGAAQPHVYAKDLALLEIPVPSLEEQQRIVCILDEALENISNSTEQIIQKIQNVNALFPSILKSLIPQDVNDCEEVLLGNKEYIQIIDGDRGVNYPKKSEFMNEGHCLFLNTKNVLRNGFNFDTTMFIDEEKDGLLRKGKLQRNDVILTTRGTLGNTAVYHDEIPFNHIRINSGMLMFRPNVEKIYPKYLYHLFTSDIVRSQISSHSRGAAQPHLPVNVLSKFLIPIPKSIDLQKVIVQRLELLATKYDLLLQKLRQEMESFDELRQSILQEAFDGKLTGGITA